MGFHHHNHGAAGKIIGAGFIGLVIGAAAGVLLASKASRQNRADFRNWMRRMNAEIYDRLGDAKEMTREKYEEIVDNVADKYRKLSDIKENEVDDFGRELKNRWERIRRRWQQ